MRSTFAGLNTMVKGIFANQVSLDTTGHNITNADTEGYSRQAVNLAATKPLNQSSIYGDVKVGTGVDSMSIERARNVYADKQYWAETAQQSYYSVMQTNYDKVEAVFNDSNNTGLQNAISEFYKSWVDLSTQASTSTNRVTVIEKGRILGDTLKTATDQLQRQIEAEYQDMQLNIQTFNDISQQIVLLNKSIMTTESTGATANDLRDERDLLVDRMSEYINLNVYEDEFGRYSVVSNGITLVDPVSCLTLKISEPDPNSTYGINDYTLKIVESNLDFNPVNGSFKGYFDAIDECKSYIDDLADMAAFLLTNFNDQHKAGAGIDSDRSAGLNFFGENKNESTSADGTADNSVIYTWDNTNKQVTATIATRNQTYTDNDSDGILDEGDDITVTYSNLGTATTYKGVEIIKMLQVASEFQEAGGDSLVAAMSGVSLNVSNDGNTITISDLNSTADGQNAVLLSSLINMSQDNYELYENAALRRVDDNDPDAGYITGADRPIGTLSMNNFYNKSMSRLGSDSQSIDTKAEAQDEVVSQIVNWRSSTSGVDWNEELTNMLMFQKGYSACARCLTTMDEMLDRLINSTGMVGR